MRVTLCGSPGSWMGEVETSCHALDHVQMVRGCTNWIEHEQEAMIATVEAILGDSDLVVLYGSAEEQDTEGWVSALWYFVDRARSTSEKLLVVTEHPTLIEDARAAVEDTRLTLIAYETTIGLENAESLGRLLFTTLQNKAAN